MENREKHLTVAGSVNAKSTQIDITAVPCRKLRLRAPRTILKAGIAELDQPINDTIPPAPYSNVASSMGLKAVLQPIPGLGLAISIKERAIFASLFAAIVERVLAEPDE